MCVQRTGRIRRRLDAPLGHARSACTAPSRCESFPGCLSGDAGDLDGDDRVGSVPHAFEESVSDAASGLGGGDVVADTNARGDRRGAVRVETSTRLKRSSCPVASALTSCGTWLMVGAGANRSLTPLTSRMAPVRISGSSAAAVGCSGAGDSAVNAVPSARCRARECLRS